MDRSMLYALALETGVSADEARQLTPNNFDLEADIPTLILPPTAASRRRHLLFPLTGVMASMMGEFMLDREVASPIFNLPDTGTMDRIVEFDAHAAGISVGTSITFASLASVFVASLHADSNGSGFRPWNGAAVQVLRSTDL
jgi:integrase